MEQRMKKDELIQLIDSLKISPDEFLILSSAALVIREIYPDAGDLDIAVTENGLKELKNNYELKQKDNGWYIVNDKVECILEKKENWKVERYEKYNLEDIAYYYEKIKSSNREKDRLRIPIVEKYINKRNKEN